MTTITRFLALSVAGLGCTASAGSLWYTNTVTPANSKIFSERWQNDGGIANTLTVVVTNDAFTGAVGSDFVVLGKVTPVNVPAGLTAAAVKATTNTLTVSLAGVADNHASSYNIANLGFTFADTAFTNGAAAAVTNYNASNLSVQYLAQNPSNWYVSVTGSDANNGTSAGTPFLTLSKAVSSAQSAANDMINMGTGSWYVADQNLGKPLTIQGAGKYLTILQATNAPYAAANKRVLRTGYNLILRQMTLQNGNVVGNGGAVGNNGINGLSDWTFENCRFLNNVATNGTSSAQGGAIYTFNNGGASAPWRAINCDFIGNRSDLGGVAWSSSQAINATNCTFIGNIATLDGGALHNAPGAPGTFYNCQFLTNICGRNGGAIYDVAAGPMQIYGSTFANNTATVGGGAIYANKTTTPTILFTSNTTFYGNSAALGGAYYGQNSWGPAGAFYNSTFVNNNAQTGGAVRLENSSTAVGLFSCIVAGNSATVAGPDLSYGTGSGTAGFNPVWYSLITSNSGALPSAYLHTRTNNLGAVITNAYLNYVGSNGVPIASAAMSALQDWGGATLTSKPIGANPAIDQGTNWVGLTYDQRGPGFNRVSGARIDMGAYETGSGPARFVYSATVFNEATANDGSIGDTNQIMLAEGIDSYSGTDGEDFVASGKLVVSNCPAGLTVVATRTSATNLNVTLVGNAAANAAANSVNDLTFVFQGPALTSGLTAGSFNFAVNSLQVLFNDNVNPSLWYSGSVFTESAGNNGAIGNTISITLSNDTFTGINDDNFVTAGRVTVANVPSGLTVVLTRQDPKTLYATLSGNAAAHHAANNVADLTFTFLNSAFALGNASIVTNAVRSDLAVQYLNPSLAYPGGTTFNESWPNDGSIANTLAITLSGDTFAGTNGQDLVASGFVVPANVPAGLTAQIVRTGPQGLTAGLAGNAVNHLSYQNVNDLTFTFQDSAFATSPAAVVTNYSRTDLSIAFLSQNVSNLYVSTLGIDTNTYDGSEAQPFRTVAYALTRAQSAANDIIHLLPGIYTESNLAVSKNVVIAGNTRDDSILQAWPSPFGAPNLSLLNVTANLTVKDLTLRNVNSTSGGAISCNLGPLIITVDGCRLTQNAATNGQGAAVNWVSNGSGNGQLNLRNSEFSYNQARTDGGAVWVNMVLVNVSNCVFLANSATNTGGALSLNVSFPHTVWDSTFVSNRAANGGGMALYTGVPLTMYNSTFAFNTATNNGGGLTTSQALQTLLHCTFYGNTAAYGGAMNTFNNGSGHIALYHTTVFSNSASVQGGGWYNYQPADLYSTIVAGNTAPTGPDIYYLSTMTDDHSLIGNNATVTSIATGAPNANLSWVGSTSAPIDPKLLALADNGGPTPTCAPQGDSPAINRGYNPLNLPWDQRGAGFARQYGAADVDIGAIEYGSHLPISGIILMIR